MAEKFIFGPLAEPGEENFRIFFYFYGHSLLDRTSLDAEIGDEEKEHGC